MASKGNSRDCKFSKTLCIIMKGKGFNQILIEKKCYHNNNPSLTKGNEKIKYTKELYY